MRHPESWAFENDRAPVAALLSHKPGEASGY